jgi:phage shock protein C
MAPTTARRVYRSRDDRVLGGVAGGLGDYLDIDPVLVRISFVALAFAGVGILGYLICWIAIPEAPPGVVADDDEHKGSLGASMVVGSVLVTLGTLFLLEQVIPVRRVLLPITIIVIGVVIMASARSRT